LVGAVDSLASRSLTLSGFPVYVARLPPAPFTEPPLAIEVNPLASKVQALRQTPKIKGQHYWMH
jgi:hypothetical protein